MVLMVMVEVIRSMFGLSLFVELLEGLPGRLDVLVWAEHSWDVVWFWLEFVQTVRDHRPPRSSRLAGQSCSRRRWWVRAVTLLVWRVLAGVQRLVDVVEGDVWGSFVVCYRRDPRPTCCPPPRCHRDCLGRMDCR